MDFSSDTWHKVVSTGSILQIIAGMPVRDQAWVICSSSCSKKAEIRRARSITSESGAKSGDEEMMVLRKDKKSTWLEHTVQDV